VKTSARALSEALGHLTRGELEAHAMSLAEQADAGAEANRLLLRLERSTHGDLDRLKRDRARLTIELRTAAALLAAGRVNGAARIVQRLARSLDLVPVGGSSGHLPRPVPPADAPANSA